MPFIMKTSDSFIYCHCWYYWRIALKFIWQATNAFINTLDNRLELWFMYSCFFIDLLSTRHLRLLQWLYKHDWEFTRGRPTTDIWCKWERVIWMQSWTVFRVDRTAFAIWTVSSWDDKVSEPLFISNVAKSKSLACILTLLDYFLTTLCL